MCVCVSSFLSVRRCVYECYLGIFYWCACAFAADRYTSWWRTSYPPSTLSLACFSRYVPTTDIFAVRQAGAYVLDFPGDCASRRSVKNVQLVFAGDNPKFRRAQKDLGDSTDGTSSASDGSGNRRRRRRQRVGWGQERELSQGAREEILLLSLGKSATDEFSLDFGWPLSPMQAFGLALAALDTSI